jgi:tol-pal system protein YbgF
MNAKKMPALAAAICAALLMTSCASHQEIPPELSQQANLQADVESLKQQVRGLKGEVEDIKYQLSAINDPDGGGGLREMAGRVQRLESNVNTMASQLAVDLGQSGGQPGVQSVAPIGSGEADVQNVAPQRIAPPPQPIPVASPARADEPAEALYAKGMKSFESRNYAQAQSLWAEFMKNYPKHSLAANALFWEGEAFYQMNDYARAALAYQDVITKYPKNIKVPSAYLKQGSSFIKMGNKKAGDLVLQDLVKKFPDSAEAKRAKALLAGK